jgi:hypothetical protein
MMTSALMSDGKVFPYGASHRRRVPVYDLAHSAPAQTPREPTGGCPLLRKDIAQRASRMTPSIPRPGVAVFTDEEQRIIDSITANGWRNGKRLLAQMRSIAALHTRNCRHAPRKALNYRAEFQALQRLGPSRARESVPILQHSWNFQTASHCEAGSLG